MVVRSNLFAAVIVTIAALIAYGQAVNFKLGRFDEEGMIVNNLRVLADSAKLSDVVKQDPFFRSPGLNFYRPVQNISIWLDAKLGKGKPKAFHVTSIILHAATAVVLLFMLNALVNNLMLSTLLAMAFAVNPLFAQAIAWVPGRGDIIVGLCGATMLYSIFRDPQLSRVRTILVVILSAAIAVFAKETAILFPLVFVIALYSTPQRASFTSRGFLISLAGMGLSGAAYLWARSIVVKQSTPGNKFGLEVLLENIRVVPEIVGKLFIPIGLSPMAAYSLAPTIIGTIILAGLVTLIIRQKDHAERMLALAGFLWFLVFTVPGAMFHHADGASAYDYLEHRAYLPALGLVILTAISLKDVISARQWTRATSVFAAGNVVYLVLAYMHASNFATPLAFYNKSVETNSRSCLALSNRGLIKEQSGDRPGALSDYSTAVSIDPTYAVALVNRGNIFAADGKREEAKQDYLNAIRYKPGLFAAQFNLGNRYLDEGKLDSAYMHYSKAAELNPKYPSTYAMMGVAASRMGNNSNAELHFSESLRLNPNNAQILLARGKVRYALGSAAAARLDWQQSAALGNAEASALLQRYPQQVGGLMPASK
jgi:tetratricopeptide (TPR) repeat protein